MQKCFGFLRGDRLHEIMRLALPSVVSNITVPLLGLVDLAIVGHLGAASYIGAVAVGSMIFNVIYWIFGYLRMSTSGETARAYGAGCDGALPLRANLRVALWVAGALMVLQGLLKRVALWLMAPSADVVPLVETYFDICIWGSPAMLCLYVLSGWFVGMQNTRIPMMVAVTQNVVNIVASVVFVFGFQWNIRGVALGTLTAQWVGVLLSAWMAYRLWKQQKSRGTVAESASVSRMEDNQRGREHVDLFVRTLCLVGVNLFFTSVGSRQGAVVLSVNSLLMTFFMLFSYVMDGFAYAAEALCGKYAGARMWRDLWDVCRHLFVLSAIVTVVFTMAYMIGGRALLCLLTDNKEVMAASGPYLWWVYLIPLAGVVSFICDGICIGISASRLMLVATSLGAMVFFVIYFLFRSSMGNHALWLALVIYLMLRGWLQLWLVLRRRAQRRCSQE